ncbi:4Fe-4S cluster-binding domain-containing protein [Pelagibacterales bacterium SAG-MED20]|nr:4Fe-4S cluster-binding domain-containing protein [Pelagibacterales bacterium SAG-MED20]
MKTYSLETLKNQIISNNGKVVIFGFGTLGKLSKKVFDKLEIKVDFFCDSDDRKNNQEHENIKVISIADLNKLDKNTNIFIAHDYFLAVMPNLDENNFKNIYTTTELLTYPNLLDMYEGDLYPLKLKRRIDFYNEISKKSEYASSGVLKIKSVDIQITEKCSLKCKDCSNLMQYYQKPKDSELNQLFKSLDNLMNVVDHVNEFRVLGGDPFMNKEMHKVVNKLSKYKNNSRIVIYTNATILPKGEQLECLRNEKVGLEITNYGEASRQHDALVTLCDKENIEYSTYKCDIWQDCGRIIPHSQKSEKEIMKQFNNCCNSDLITLLHGNLYRCPFSANGNNLRAFNENESDVIDLTKNYETKDELKKMIKELCYDKKFLNACFSCNGRDFTTMNIKSAIQTLDKKPIEYKKLES